jgi:hypothetical protein
MSIPVAPEPMLTEGLEGLGGLGGMVGAKYMALFAVVVALWKNLKIFFGKITSLLIIRVAIKDYTMCEAVKILINNEFRCSPLGTKTYNGSNEYVRPEKRNLLVAMEPIPTEATVWWRGKRPLIISGDSHNSINLTFIRGIYNRDKIINEAVNKFNQEQNTDGGDDWRRGDRFFIRRKTGSIGEMRGSQGKDEMSDEPAVAEATAGTDKRYSRILQWTKDDLGQPKRKKPMEILSLTVEQKDVITEAIRWRSSEKWFKDKTIPWKRGICFWGAPGTGKTAYVRALAQELNVPIFSFDLATMSNKDLTSNWKSIMSYTPCIALFEDIDAVFDGRKNVAVNGMENGLTFDCFLNTLDGVENTDGVFIVVTTNNVEKLDPAIGNCSNGDGSSLPYTLQ